MDYSVTIATLTRKRPDLLMRAIRSVKKQDYPHPIDHLIVVDGCVATRSLLRRMQRRQHLRWHYLNREIGQVSGPSHLAALRNYAVRTATSRWIAFLDDDNEYECDHISSLVACARKTGCRAVHSHMRIFTKDGNPYLDQRMPWCRDPLEARKLYEELCEKGVFSIGSNIVRDRADALGHPSPARTVDTGEWLFERTLLLEYTFDVSYSETDWCNVATEDDKLMHTLIENRVSIACTGRPTLRYYLGGYSNDFPGDIEQGRDRKTWIIDDDERGPMGVK